MLLQSVTVSSVYYDAAETMEKACAGWKEGVEVIMRKDFVLKGDICYTEERTKFITYEDSYLVCSDGRTDGIYKELPGKYSDYKLYDYSGRLIIPGITDLHLHAPQYVFRGLGMDMELLDWLNGITFPQEARYSDIGYAKEAYGIFTEDLLHSVTTRASVFATIHVPATVLLMDMLDRAGIAAYVGKVNMDRNSPDILRETAKTSAEDTIRWIEETKDKYEHVRPIITPRFIPSCTDELMRSLSDIQKQTGLPVQSHLNENFGEIAWVKELCPDTADYSDAYDSFDMFGGDCRTIMAHCVHMNDREISLLADRGVFVAHSPQSNTNLRSGVAPVRRFLDAGVKVGLASDVAGGATLSMFRIMTDCIQASKLRWRLQDDSLTSISAEEAFYMATKGGGEFFGRVGSFEPDYEFDAVVIDDKKARTLLSLSIRDRLERTLYLAESNAVTAKFICGNKVL